MAVHFSFSHATIFVLVPKTVFDWHLSRVEGDRGAEGDDAKEECDQEEEFCNVLHAVIERGVQVQRSEQVLPERRLALDQTHLSFDLDGEADYRTFRSRILDLFVFSHRSA